MILKTASNNWATRRAVVWLLFAIAASITAVPAFAATGHTVGKFAVSSTGGATYSIPIWVPPGIRNVQPHLALNYDSHFPSGLMGPGWAIAGLSIIARCNRTYAQDGVPAPIQLATTDGLCLDGNRLRTTGTATYQTEIANFALVTSSGTAGNGPSYFTVQGRDGLTYEYGNTTDSKIIPSGQSTPYIWALDKVTDRYGNTMTVTYYQSGGAYIPLSIQYTAPSGSTSYPYQVVFDYTTKSSNDLISAYIAGSQILLTQQLADIKVEYNNSIVRQYNLSYTTSTATLRATLTSIQECGVNTDCLSPTAITYQNGTAGVASPTTATGSGSTNGLLYSVDIDGDGLQDLVFATTSGSNNQWWVQFATGSGYKSPVSVGLSTPTSSNILIDDFFGNGKSEILGQVSGYWWGYQWNGSSFVGANTGLPVTAGLVTGQVGSADGDGDGLPDVWAITNPVANISTIYFYKNQSSSSGISFATTPITGQLYNPNSPGPQMRGNNMFPNSTVKHVDSNGDGRSEVLIEYGSALGTRLIQGYQVNGSTVLAAGPAIGTGSIAQFLPVNWNDDACTDGISSGAVEVSYCSGTSAASISLPAQPTLALDWDGDGRTDALINVSNTWQVVRSQGNAAAPAVATGISVVGTGTYVATDVNGDGLDDLVFPDSTASNSLKFGSHNGASTPPDLAITFDDKYGNTVKPSYLPITNTSNYTQYSDAVYPYENYIGPYYIVNQVVYSDPTNEPSGTFYINYYYNGVWMNLQGRGLQAFYAISGVDSRTGIRDSEYYQRLFPETGMNWSSSPTLDGVHNISQRVDTDTYTTLDSTTNNQRYFPYVSSSVFKQYEVGGTENQQLITTTSTTYTFDNYGNATNIASTVTDNDPGSPYVNQQWTSTVATTITPDTSANWCLSMPTQLQVTNAAPGSSAITRTIGFTPDYTKCHETQKVTEPSSAKYKATDAYGFDSFGNINSDSVTGVGMTARTTTINWGTTGQFPSTITNPLGWVMNIGYDLSKGVPTSQTDPNSTSGNVIQTTWGYDNLARKTLETRPDSTSTTWAYNPCATNGCVNSNNQMTVVATVKNTGGSTQSIHNTYLDSRDRTLVTSNLMLNGAYDRRDTQYDNLGRVAKTGAPCTFVLAGCSTPYWTTNSYDVLNRITLSQRPISAANGTLQSTVYAYAGRATTITDANGHATTITKYVTGALARNTDANGYYQNLTYDGFGSLLGVSDFLSNTLFTGSYDYGIGAFQTNATDMDLDKSTAAGQHRTFTFDALGEVTNWSDAKGQSFSQTYDALSRPMVRTEPDLTTTWTWGTSAAKQEIGQLNSVQAGSYFESYSYDSRTRLSVKGVYIPGQGWFYYNYSYNGTTGFLDTLTYPTSTSGYQLKLQYGYTNGILSTISDFNASSTVFWTANTMDPRGQLTQETLGNGTANIVSNHTYDAVTGWLANQYAGVNGSSTLQNSAYLFDYVGNVTQRQDGHEGLTENFYYDTLNRLDHSTINGNASLQMHYDALGNISSRSDLANGATWTYDPNKKHAVTHAGSTSYAYTYDNNGNALTRNGSTITWTSYNYPATISPTSGSSETASFGYGQNRQRWVNVYTNSSGTETTYFIDKKIDLVFNGSAYDFRHYIFAGNELVAIYSRTGAGVNTLRYVLNDHQGSFASIESTAGTGIVYESFAPYGARRNPATWSGPPSTQDQSTIDGISRNGFTGHLMLGDSMGLIHMNGRVEDAITGRFLSADPYIPNPLGTQSFNRYSYVNNNPLTYRDASGFDPVLLDEIVVESGGTNVVADALAVIADILGVSGLFGAAPVYTPAQISAMSHGVDISRPLPHMQLSQTSVTGQATSSIVPASQNDIATITVTGQATNSIIPVSQAQIASFGYATLNATINSPGDLNTSARNGASDSLHTSPDSLNAFDAHPALGEIEVDAIRGNSFNFAGIGRSAAFLAGKPWLNLAAIGVLGTSGAYIGGGFTAGELSIPSLVPRPFPPGWNSNWEFRFPEGYGDETPRWFDETGGEWRFHNIDPWHDIAHWDYNPWDQWNSAWQNIYP